MTIYFAMSMSRVLTLIEFNAVIQNHPHDISSDNYEIVVAALLAQ